MSLQLVANHLAAQGRGPDTTLVHMAPREVASLQDLARQHGGSLTINPHTGLPEAGFLESLLPMALGAGAMMLPGMQGIGAGYIGLGVGALQGIRTGSLGKGVMAGLGAYGGASMAGGLLGSGAVAGDEVVKDQMAELQIQQADAANKALGARAQQAAAKQAADLTAQIQQQQAVALAKNTGDSFMGNLSSNLSTAGKGLTNGFSNFSNSVGMVPGSIGFKTALGAAAIPTLMGGLEDSGSAPEQKTSDSDRGAMAKKGLQYYPNFVGPYQSGSSGGEYTYMRPYYGADGGAVGMADGGYAGAVRPDNPYYQSPEYKAYQEANNNPFGMVGTADMYDSPYFGTVGSGGLGRQNDRAYESYLGRTAQESMPTNPPPDRGSNYIDPIFPGNSPTPQPFTPTPTPTPQPAITPLNFGDGSGVTPALRMYQQLEQQRANRGPQTDTKREYMDYMNSMRSNVQPVRPPFRYAPQPIDAPLPAPSLPVIETPGQGGGGGGGGGGGEGGGGMDADQRAAQEAARNEPNAMFNGLSSNEYFGGLGLTHEEQSAVRAQADKDNPKTAAAIKFAKFAAAPVYSLANAVFGETPVPADPLYSSIVNADLESRLTGERAFMASPEGIAQQQADARADRESQGGSRDAAPGTGNYGDARGDLRGGGFGNDGNGGNEGAGGSYGPSSQDGGDGGSGYAQGGIANLHQYNLGSYSDGGRLLKGPGDGVSDSIPATIGKGQPARLADGEFVIPARIVSEIGNGSTEAGARKLYAMMDRIQKGRRKTVGRGKVAVNSRADRYLPA